MHPSVLFCASPTALAAKRTESHSRSRGNRTQPSASPRLQNSRNSSCDGVSPSYPGAEHCPLHPHPNGSRRACSQFPFSNFSTGIKNGQATNPSAEHKILKCYGLHSTHLSPSNPIKNRTGGEAAVCSNLISTEN